MTKLIKDLAREGFVILACAAGVLVLLAFLHLPLDTDASEKPQPADEAQGFYEKVYAPGAPVETEADDSAKNEHEYVVSGKEASEVLGITEFMRQFVAEYGLENARVLEVGAGSGQLQDVVEDYTGLDIAASAARYFHKPFVQGSATELPFRDSEFDAAWTVWVLEHVDAPERALAELRRVVKPGGLLFILPAWNCSSWAAEGYEVRPYSDFDFTGKIIKASVPIRNHPLFRMAYLAPIRAFRRASWEYTGQPTTLHYAALTPNYDHYWTFDSDATVALDPHEAMLWYVSRGDECLNCPTDFSEQILMGRQQLIIRVNKPGTNRAHGAGESTSGHKAGRTKGG